MRGVTNLVTVRPKSNISPDELRRKIQEALMRAAEVDAKQIEIDVQGDTVVLKGTVRSWDERQEAERAAWSAPGVTTVKNRIVATTILTTTASLVTLYCASFCRC